MLVQKCLRPRLENLESKTVMSAGLATAPAKLAAALHTPVGTAAAQLPETAGHGTQTGTSDSVLVPQSHTRINLNGSASGDYTSTIGKPDNSIRYHLNATGKIAPIGSVVVRGSFDNAGSIRSGQASGTLTIVGAHGKLTIKLTAARPIAADVSNDADDSVNPGGPIRGLSSANAGGPIKGGSTSTVGVPVILVHNFTYTITRGTGDYANDRGSGTVEITTTPGLTTPQGPGIYSSAAVTEPGIGRTTVTFPSGVLPLI